MEIQDIAKFAENLLENKVTEVKETGIAPDMPMAAQAPNAPDISRVQISEDFQRKVLEESFKIKATPTPDRVNEELAYKESLAEAYEQKLFELEELVSEMTSVGMIGSGVGHGLGTARQPVQRKKKKKKKITNARTPRSSY
tara:strand:- start:743 stop:1165 length:423 start_codon:yes stop_codon:yes gene_type:complete